jgi:hypothetical protein
MREAKLEETATGKRKSEEPCVLFTFGNRLPDAATH